MLRRSSDQPAQQTNDVLHVSTNVIEHHRHKKQPDYQQTAFENALTCLSAERAAFDRLREVEKNLSAIENGNRQQIEHVDVDTYERNKQQQRFDPPTRRLNRDLCNRAWTTKIGNAHSVYQRAKRREDLASVIEGEAPRFSESLAYRDRNEAFARNHPDSAQRAWNASARIRRLLSDRSHLHVNRLTLSNDSQIQTP